ncbi:MAG: DUF333 domain-containing protein [bacterium]
MKREISCVKFLSFIVCLVVLHLLISPVIAQQLYSRAKALALPEKPDSGQVSVKIYHETAILSDISKSLIDNAPLDIAPVPLIAPAPTAASYQPKLISTASNSSVISRYTAYNPLTAFDVPGNTCGNIGRSGYAYTNTFSWPDSSFGSSNLFGRTDYSSFGNTNLFGNYSSFGNSSLSGWTGNLFGSGYGVYNGYGLYSGYGNFTSIFNSNFQVPWLNNGGQSGNAGLPNPAAVYCKENGGTYEIRTAADGSQSGVCIFSDGTECDGWAYYRGECEPSGSHDAMPPLDGGKPGDPIGQPNPAAVYCAENDGDYQIRTSPKDGSQYGVCVFSDGSECDEWAFFRGECEPSQPSLPPGSQEGVIGMNVLYCLENGGAIEIRTNDEGSRYKACVFSDGSACDAWAYHRGECQPGDNPAGPIGMANPSAVYCTETGGTYEIRTNEDGSQSGVCIFGDGTECDAWVYYLGECQTSDRPNIMPPLDGKRPGVGGEPSIVPIGQTPTIIGMANPASVYCIENGGISEIRTDENGGQYGVCIFSDGTECDEWAFFRGECQAYAMPQISPAYLKGSADRAW